MKADAEGAVDKVRVISSEKVLEGEVVRHVVRFQFLKRGMINVSVEPASGNCKTGNGASWKVC